MEPITIFFSVEAAGYGCSIVIANLSRNASFRMLVPIKRPSSEPLPLVLAVAITLNPSLGVIHLLIFFKNTPLPSRTGCNASNLLEPRSHSSSNKVHPRSIASITGPGTNLVSPATKRKPPSKSSSSVSIVILIRINSFFNSACNCSIIRVLPLPDKPVTNTG